MQAAGCGADEGGVTVANTPEAWTFRAETAAQSWEAAMWSEQGQQQRFQAVRKALDPQPGETLLDFGCGTGSFSRLVPETSYVGYDWAQGMIDRAWREHGSFGRVFTNTPPAKSFDLVAAVGPFNLPHRWCKCRTWETLEDLWELCDRRMAVSLYAGTCFECLIYTEIEVKGWAIRTGAGFQVERHLSNDLLLVLDRGDNYSPSAQLSAGTVGGREDQVGGRGGLARRGPVQP